MRPLLWVCTVALALPSVSCFRLLFGPPWFFDIRYQVAEPQNGADRGEPKLAEMRFFFLKDPAKFQSADFKDLEGDRYKATLGDDVAVDSRSLHEFRPPRIGVHVGGFPAAVKYVGMVAVFKKVDGSLTRDRAWVPRYELDYYTYEIKDGRFTVARK